MLKGFSAVPPLLSDIDLSLDDRYLYASCWGTGEMRQYDVSDPFNPKLVGSVHIGGIVRRAAAPANSVETARGGGRKWSKSAAMAAESTSPTRSTVRGTINSIPTAWKSWMVKLDVGDDGKIEFDRNFFVEFDPSHRVHQVRLQGGDASSDSYCYS